MPKTFEMPQKVLFKHCDPAGIVFFPRYFEMMNDCVEAFFDQALGLPFETLHRRFAVPTAAIETEFRRPSRHGDALVLSLRTASLGRSSWSYRMTCRAGDEIRFLTRATLVQIDSAGKPTPWPEALRQTLTDYEADHDP
ncbi:MAG: thioesterase family protein [Pseudomonadota bacterium]